MIDPQELVWQAALSTIVEAGPLPEHIEGMPDHIARWILLMRDQEPRLCAPSDAEIITAWNLI